MTTFNKVKSLLELNTLKGVGVKRKEAIKLLKDNGYKIIKK